MRFALVRAHRKKLVKRAGKMKCAYCRRLLKHATGGRQTPLTRTWDHVQPKRLGGTWRVRCCYQCNQLKRGMTFPEWQAFMDANPKWWLPDRRRVVDTSRLGWWRFHEHYDRHGYSLICLPGPEHDRK